MKPVLDHLENNNNSFLFDERENLSPGFKFNEWEMKGVPIRIEIGLRDCNNKILTIARRDKNEKINVDIHKSCEFIIQQLEDIQNCLFNKAYDFQQKNTFRVENYNEFKKIIENGGFVRCGWDGTNETELKIKKETNATIRCIPLDTNNIQNLKCIYSNETAKHEVIFAKAY